jgi:hypothetical protein
MPHMASSIGIATSLGAGRPRSRGSIPGRDKRFFSITSRSILGPTKSPTLWALRSASLGVKRQEREADYSPPSSAEVKNDGPITSIPLSVFLTWCLINYAHG